MSSQYAVLNAVYNCSHEQETKGTTVQTWIRRRTRDALERLRTQTTHQPQMILLAESNLGSCSGQTQIIHPITCAGPGAADSPVLGRAVAGNMQPDLLLAKLYSTTSICHC